MYKNPNLLNHLKEEDVIIHSRLLMKEITNNKHKILLKNNLIKPSNKSNNSLPKSNNNRLFHYNRYIKSNNKKIIRLF